MTAKTEHATRAWYLIQCKARQDERAQEHLQRQGYTCFRSTCKRERQLKGGRRVVSESLFPGYLFIHLGLQDSWSPLRSTRGVSRVVTFGGHPLPVSDALVNELQERDDQINVATSLQPGDSVRISDGPFAELEAVFIGMAGDERVLVLMNFLHREQQINVPLAEIRKLKFPPCNARR